MEDEMLCKKEEIFWWEFIQKDDGKAFVNYVPGEECEELS